MPTGESPPEGSKPRSIGSYRIVQQLGSGGMSTVFRCIHQQTGAEVAVKILPRSLAKNPTLLQRFVNEAKNAEKLQHPNIVAIYDRGFDQERHYLVLEFVAGGDLSDRVRNEGPLPIPEAVRVIREVAEGLRYAAKQGVIHRDIKPANLLLSPDGHVKIIDLGLAVETEEEDERVTREGTTVGTVDYMAPEQARNSRATSESSDIYSLGCTFYYLLTGSPPYPGGDVIEKLSRHCTAPIPDVRGKRPEVPEALALLVKRMMAKKPLQRFGSHAEFLVALNALRLDQPAAPLMDTPLTALIVDDDVEIDDTPIALLPEARPTSGSSPTLPAPSASKRPASRVDQPLALADLLDLEQTSEPPAARRKPKPSAPAAVLMAEVLDDDDEADDDLYSPTPARNVRASKAPGFFEKNSSLQTFIGVGVAIGLAIAIVGVGLIQIYIAATETEVSQALPGTVTEGRDPTEPVDEGTARERVQPPPVATVASIPKPAPPATSNPGPTKIDAVWIEPGDPPTRDPGAVPLPVVASSTFLPDWARGSSSKPTSDGGTLVRRRDETSEPGRSPLASALAGPSQRVSIADDGPFFQDDWKVAGAVKTIAAAPGYRPMFVLQTSKSTGTEPGSRPAGFDFEPGSEVTFQGIDFVVESKGLPSTNSAIFVARGASLRFVDCTFTLVGSTRSVALTRVPSASPAQPARVAFERCMVRGAWSRLAVVEPRALDCVLLHSSIVIDEGPIFEFLPSTSRESRRIFAVESLLAARGTVLAGSGDENDPVTIRALRTLLAKLDPGDRTGVISLRAPSSSRVGWAGIDCIAEACRFRGWPGILSETGNGAGRLVTAEEVAKRGPKALVDCRFESGPWPGSLVRDDLDLPELLDLIGREDPLAVALAREVALPTPGLRFMTVAAFPAPVVPSLRQIPDRASTVVPDGVAGVWTELEFDASSGEDLGAFLKERTSASAGLYRVRLRGRGIQPMQPTELPRGSTLELVGPTFAAGSTGGPIPAREELVIVPSPGPAADALLSVRDGSIRLAGIRMDKTESRTLGALIHVDNGHVVLEGSRLTSGERSATDRSTLISFRSPSSRPRGVKEASPFTIAEPRPCLIVDRSVLLAARDAIVAELGTGLISITNSLVEADRGAAFTFKPGSCARGRFDVKTRIEASTIVAARTFFRIGNWPGTPPGPDLPWLIWSRGSLYHDSSPHPKREAVLFRASAETLGHDVVFWQGDSNFLDLVGFRAVSDLAGPSRRENADLERLWTEYWGPVHVVKTSGPASRGALKGETPPLRFAASRDGRPLEGASRFALDPSAHPGLGADFAVLPLPGDPPPRP
ncbi:MAG: protein kinase [Isosphaeraceae bacterium]|nr:protein kinase [Isosphaeraceae bacterium]